MSLMFTGPNEGWQLECDTCFESGFMDRWADASTLVLEAELDGWKLEEYDRWDGVTYAEAECPGCNGTDEEQR